MQLPANQASSTNAVGDNTTSSTTNYVNQVKEVAEVVGKYLPTKEQLEHTYTNYVIPAWEKMPSRGEIQEFVSTQVIPPIQSSYSYLKERSQEFKSDTSTQLNRNNAESKSSLSNQGDTKNAIDKYSLTKEEPKAPTSNIKEHLEYSVAKVASTAQNVYAKLPNKEELEHYSKEVKQSATKVAGTAQDIYAKLPSKEEMTEYYEQAKEKTVPYLYPASLFLAQQGEKLGTKLNEYSQYLTKVLKENPPVERKQTSAI